MQFWERQKGGKAKGWGNRWKYHKWGKDKAQRCTVSTKWRGNRKPRIIVPFRHRKKSQFLHLQSIFSVPIYVWNTDPQPGNKITFSSDIPQCWLYRALVFVQSSDSPRLHFWIIAQLDSLPLAITLHSSAETGRRSQTSASAISWFRVKSFAPHTSLIGV